ncbi:MAG: hypothetical protein GC129_00525 [Proteobacteria bacterium]|nr:hypothetical protein [Pseudomonadota bacterium]
MQEVTYTISLLKWLKPSWAIDSLTYRRLTLRMLLIVIPYMLLLVPFILFEKFLPSLLVSAYAWLGLAGLVCGGCYATVKLIVPRAHALGVSWIHVFAALMAPALFQLAAQLVAIVLTKGFGITAEQALPVIHSPAFAVPFELVFIALSIYAVWWNYKLLLVDNQTLDPRWPMVHPFEKYGPPGKIENILTRLFTIGLLISFFLEPLSSLRELIIYLIN